MTDPATAYFFKKYYRNIIKWWFVVYNPDFLISFDKNSECYCVINDFDREIKVIPDEKHNNHVIGIGNNCFKNQCR